MTHSVGELVAANVNVSAPLAIVALAVVLVVIAGY
jgi:hypothetical protein